MNEKTVSIVVFIFCMLIGGGYVIVVTLFLAQGLGTLLEKIVMGLLGSGALGGVLLTWHYLFADRDENGK